MPAENIFSVFTLLESNTAPTDFFQYNVTASGSQELSRNLPRTYDSLIWATLRASGRPALPVRIEGCLRLPLLTKGTILAMTSCTASLSPKPTPG